MADEPRPTTTRANARRFAPFIVLAALQLAFLALVVPRSETTTLTNTGAGAGSDGQAFEGGGPGGGAGDDPTGVTAVGDVGTEGGALGPASGPGQSKAGPGRAAGTVSASGQKVDALGRPLEGDRSKCGKDGLMQQDSSSYTVLCTPALEGDNGGATSRGVTKDEILIVQYMFKANESINAALATQGLAASDDKVAEVTKIFEKFFNKHYEFYGRKVRYEQFRGTCEATDYACYRSDAKALVKKHQPFAVMRYQGPWQLADELARQGVIVFGSSWGMPRRFYQERRPYVWDIFPDGETVSDLLAEYWCKKLAGKTAEYSSDPALKTRIRKLALFSYDDAPGLEVGNRFVSLVNGGMCGGPTKAAIYTITNDTAAAQQQLPAVINRMKQDGVTTVANLRCDFTYNLLITPAFDNQSYFPEHLLSGTGACDHDLVGRFASPTQRAAFIGNGFQPKLVPIEQQDDYKAVKEIEPDYTYDSYVLLADWIFNHNLIFLLQAAGPRLTPATFERGAQALPQIGGWKNANPYTGWKCCNPLVTLHKYTPTRYAANADTRNIYWDERAVSVIDGKPGAYICAEGCRRYTTGEMTAAKPR